MLDQCWVGVIGRGLLTLFQWSSRPPMRIQISRMCPQRAYCFDCLASSVWAQICELSNIGLYRKSEWSSLMPSNYEKCYRKTTKFVLDSEYYWDWGLRKCIWARFQILLEMASRFHGVYFLVSSARAQDLPSQGSNQGFRFPPNETRWRSSKTNLTENFLSEQRFCFRRSHLCHNAKFVETA